MAQVWGRGCLAAVWVLPLCSQVALLWSHKVHPLTDNPLVLPWDRSRQGTEWALPPAPAPGCIPFLTRDNSLLSSCSPLFALLRVPGPRRTGPAGPTGWRALGLSCPTALLLTAWALAEEVQAHACHLAVSPAPTKQRRRGCDKEHHDVLTTASFLARWVHL